MRAHGYMRATADSDFLFRRTPEYVHRVHAAFEEFGAPLVVFDREHFEAPVRGQSRTSVQPLPVERVECEKNV